MRLTYLLAPVLLVSTTLFAASKVAVPAGTSIQARMTSTISSNTARPGDPVTMEAVDDVLVGQQVVISRGAMIRGEVTEAKERGRIGKSGKLGIVFKTVRAVDGKSIELRAEIAQQGRSGYGAGSAVGVAATGLLFFPAGPLWLLKQGHDITIPMGTLLTVRTATEAEVDPSAYVPSSPIPAAATIPAASAAPEPVANRMIMIRGESNPEVEQESVAEAARRYRAQKQTAKTER